MLFIFLASLVSTATALSRDAPSLPLSWQTTGRAAAPDTICVIVALKQRNLEQLPSLVLAVSNPTSPTYGQYLTKGQLDALTAPAPEAFDAVAQWLSAGGTHVVNIQRSAATVAATLPVAHAEAIFNTKFYSVESVTTGQSKIRAHGAYTVPSSVEAHVDNVLGLHGLPLPPRTAIQSPAARTSTAPKVDPSVIATQYGIAGVTTSGSTTNRQSVAEFQGQTMNPDDLAAFFAKYVSASPASDGVVYKTHGEPTPGAGAEALLDIEYIMGVAPGIKTEFFEQISSDFGADLLAWTSLLLGADAGINVHSISYGFQGDLSLLGLKEADIVTIDTNFQKLAAKGVTLIFASGDSGSGYTKAPPVQTKCPATPFVKDVVFVGSVAQTFTVPGAVTQGSAAACCESCGQPSGPIAACTNWTVANIAGGKSQCTLYSRITGTTPSSGALSGGRGEAPPTAAKLYPSWPASSPWVTAVGATRFLHDQVGAMVEEAAVSAEDHFGSGGGFSRRFPVADYQANAVARYFSSVAASTLPDPSVATYAKGGRGTPDVSAIGTGFEVVLHNNTVIVGGTSASAPTFAAMVSLLNEARAAKGKPPLGFLNPFIYQNTDAFTDVTTGWSRVGRGGTTLPAGFNCSTGWDPITGVGTPNFTALLKAALAAGGGSSPRREPKE